MITDFTNRHPGLSALIILLLFAVVPAAFMFPINSLSGGSVNAAKIIFVYVLALQLVLWLKVEQPVLIILPFLLSLGGFIAAEIVYTVSESMNEPGVGPGALAFNISSALVTVFGAVVVGSLAGLVAYGLIVIARKIREVVAP